MNKGLDNIYVNSKTININYSLKTSSADVVQKYVLQRIRYVINRIVTTYTLCYNKGLLGYALYI